METIRDGQVALLIDFENLVRGIGDDETIDCEVLFRLAEDYGRVLVANAYADWRMRDVNQYQTDLYRLGVELVHVFGKGWGERFKNAVDVKMAVDAIGAVSSWPHIDVFVIVSGDRDFIHVLKALRRHGKTVVGVSPDDAASDDFAALCDRFVNYEALAKAYDLPAPAGDSPGKGTDRPGLERVKQALRSIMTTRPEGIKGAMIKPLLRRELEPTFDESKYGFSRLTELLRSLNDVVRVEAPEGGGDVLVFPASVADEVEMKEPESDTLALLRQANLPFYRFEQDAVRRRRILGTLFDAMNHQKFTWNDVQQRVLEKLSDSDISMSVTVLSKYKSMIYHGHGFKLEPDQENLPQRERLMSLRDNIRSRDDLIRHYETSVAYKVMCAAGEDCEVLASTLVDILGLPSDGNGAIEYCRSLLENASSIVGEGIEIEATKPTA